jgi:hypothetical protein
MENEIILFECCVGYCEPKCKGNIGDVYYICVECFDIDTNMDEQREKSTNKQYKNNTRINNSKKW